MEPIISPETVKSMKHVDRMFMLGVTVRNRIKANELLVSPKPADRVEGLKLHTEAANLAHVLRY